jgi:hypothetical protein
VRSSLDLRRERERAEPPAILPFDGDARQRGQIDRVPRPRFLHRAYAIDMPKNGRAAAMNYAGETGGCVLLRRIAMMKRLILIIFAIAAYGVPASAASLSIFAYNDAGRPVLEFDPATVFAFSAEGRDLLSVTVKQTPPDSEPHDPTDLAVIVDCRLRQIAASPVTPVAGSAPSATIAGFKTSDLKPVGKGMYERFVVAVCDGELSGVNASPAKSGWTHFIEGPQRALYFANGSARTIGKYRAASVRLYELGGAQLPDGRHIDARDAVWVIDCGEKLGAVAYERAFARVMDKNQTVESTGDEKAFAEPSHVEVDKLKFGRPVAGSMQARFSETLCAMNEGSRPAAN